MFGDLIVPLDGSDESARALGPAGAIARFLDNEVKLVSVVSPAERDDRLAWMTSLARSLGPVRRELVVDSSGVKVADALEERVSDHPGDLVCMATRGRGRAAGALGSVAAEMLRRLSGPALLIGPDCLEHRFRCNGNMVVSVDGSKHSEAILPVAEAFATVFGFDVTVASVVDPRSARAGQVAGASSFEPVVESSYVHRVAAGAEAEIGRPVSWEVLHGDHPAKAIVAQAEAIDATLVAMATHGRAGMRRIVAGSVTADVIRHAPCPVLALRPPELAR